MVSPESNLVVQGPSVITRRDRWGRPCVRFAGRQRSDVAALAERFGDLEKVPGGRLADSTLKYPANLPEKFQLLPSNPGQEAKEDKKKDRSIEEKERWRTVLGEKGEKEEIVEGRGERGTGAGDVWGKRSSATCRDRRNECRRAQSADGERIDYRRESKRGANVPARCEGVSHPHQGGQTRAFPRACPRWG